MVSTSQKKFKKIITSFIILVFLFSAGSTVLLYIGTQETQAPSATNTNDSENQSEIPSSPDESQPEFTGLNLDLPETAESISGENLELNTEIQPENPQQPASE